MNGALTISPAALTITANNQTMTYGGAVPALTASYSGFVNGDTSASLSPTPTLATTATPASDVGSYAITPSGARDSDYTITYVAGTLTITPAALTITANNQTMTYGGAVPALTASYSGFVNGDTSASLTAPPILMTTAMATSHVGSYSVTPSGAQDSDYTISYVAGALTISPAPLTITAVGQSMTYGGALPALTSSYSGFVNGDTSASLTTPPTLTATATAASHVGSYAITVGGAQDSDYTITYAAGSLTISPAALTITANNQTMTYGGPTPVLTATYSGFVNGDTPASLSLTPTLATTATPASDVGSYAITPSGARDSDYTITYVAGTLTITPAQLLIIPDNEAMTYGGPWPTFTVSYRGFVNGDPPIGVTPIITTPATPSSHVGTYPIAVSGLQLRDYSITYETGTLTISPAALTITANNQSMTYGGLMPALTVSYSGLVNGDTPATFAQPPNVAPSAHTVAASSHVGSYAITVGGRRTATIPSPTPPVR